jgi:hypothetical protein
MFASVSEECAASNFKVKQKVEQANKQASLVGLSLRP